MGRWGILNLEGEFSSGVLEFHGLNSFLRIQHISDHAVQNSNGPRRGNVAATEFVLDVSLWRERGR